MEHCFTKWYSVVFELLSKLFTDRMFRILLVRPSCGQMLQPPETFNSKSDFVKSSCMELDLSKSAPSYEALHKFNHGT